MSSPDLFHRPAALYVLYGLLSVLVCLIVIPTWGWTYWDFGDGNYMYIARRVLEGEVLYRDILAPQPPVHTLAGVVAEWLGGLLFGSHLIGVRVYCLLVRLCEGLLVMMLARRFFGCPFRAIVAAAVFLFMPIGFWWSLGYQSENLEIVFLLAAILLLLDFTPRRALIAGIFSALACHVNMTAVPFFLANVVFLIFRRRGLLLWYLPVFALVYGLIAVVVNAWSDGAFVSNVLLNQVGTFPDSNILAYYSPGDNFWKYAWRKITAEGAKVLDLEGGLIVAALVGAVLTMRRAPDPQQGEEERYRFHRAEFLAWQLIAGFLSICFVAKGGTVNYIFVLGEPMIAVFAAEGFVQLWRSFFPRGGEWRTLSIWNTRAFLLALFPVLVLGVVYYPVIRNIRFTLHEVQVELAEREVQELRAFILTYAEPGEIILAPPFYAFATETIVAAEVAENYIWNIKYSTEQFYNRPEDGTAKMQELAALLRERKAKVVLLDLAQTGSVPEVREAIAEHYRLAEEEPYLTRNTRLGLYIPKDVEPHHIPLTR